MGCDIHAHAERKTERGWRHCGEVDMDRNYALFGWLADVRNYSALTPIAKGRGIPADIAPTTRESYENWSGDAHSESWVSMDELKHFDYDAQVEDRRVTRQVGPNAWNGGCTAEPGDGAPTTYRDLFGPRFFSALERLRHDGAERVVFWFDN